MRRIIVAFALGSGFIANALGANWQDLGKDHWYDASSIRGDGPVVDVWVKRTYSKPQNFDVDGRVYQRTMVRERHNCRAHQVSYLSMVYYTDEEGLNVLSSGKGDGTWNDIVPDSYGEATHVAVCPPTRRASSGR